jgi:hypothetical protein
MKIIVDGKEIEANEVRVITQIGDEEEHELHTIITHEGVIFDAVNGEGNVSLTGGETFNEVFDRLLNEAFEIVSDLELDRSV